MTFRSVGALRLVLSAALGAVLAALLLVGAGAGVSGAGMSGAGMSGAGPSGAGPSGAGVRAAATATVAPVRTGGRITVTTARSELRHEIRPRVETATSTGKTRPSANSAPMGPQVLATLPNRRGPPAMARLGVAPIATTHAPASAPLSSGAARAPPASA